MDLSKKMSELVQQPGIVTYVAECHEKLGRGCVYAWFGDASELDSHKQVSYMPLNHIPSTETRLRETIETCDYSKSFVVFVGCGDDALVNVVDCYAENP